MSLFTDSNSSIDHLSFEDIIFLLIIRLFQTKELHARPIHFLDRQAFYDDKNVSFKLVILNGVLDHVEQDQLVVEPVCLNVHAAVKVHRDVNAYLLPSDLTLKRKDHLSDE